MLSDGSKEWFGQPSQNHRGGLLLVVLSFCLASADLDPAWENIFRTRSDSEWRSLWHNERHRRCYQDLLVHMEWVCDNDIYKLKRRKRHLDSEEEDTTEPKGEASPFLNSARAARVLGFSSPNRLKRLKGGEAAKRGIIDECCHGADGCSWEEYAEYCPANRRVRT